MNKIILLIIVSGLIYLGLSVRALRKTIGLALVVFGAIISLTLIGFIVGLPMVLVGGFLLFIGNKR
jgi:hypothetical protein